MTASFWTLAEPRWGAERGGRGWRGWGWAMVLAALFFLTQLPQLTWLPFSGGSENLNIATVLELHRSESWWVPTLRERPRLIKPPLTAWVTAAAVRPGTVAKLDDPDAAVRAQAYRDLAMQSRLPALVATTAMLLAVFEAGRLLLGRREGLVAMAAAGTCLLTLRFGRFATTDVMLAAFTSWTFVALLHAYVRGRLWAGLVGAGLGMGLGMMSKGPVALVFTLVPLAGLMAAMGLRGVCWRRWVWPGVAGVGVFAVVGLTWFADQFRVHGEELLSMWRTEVLRAGATQLPPDPWYTYAVLVPMMLPWAGFFLAGMVAFVGRRRAEGGLVWGLLGAVVVMSLFDDKNERYLLPAVLGGSLVTAAAVVRLYATQGAGSGSGVAHPWHRVLRDVAMAVPWAMGVGLAVAGAVGGEQMAGLGLVRVGGGAWHGWGLAALMLSGLAGLLAVGAWLQRRWWAGSFATAAAGMVLTGAVFLHGYAASPGGASAFQPVADLIRTEYDPAGRRVIELRDTDVRFDHELNIYLNRVLPGVSSAEQVAEPDAVLLMIRRSSAKVPEPPAGWEVRHRLAAHKRVVYVLERVRPAGVYQSRVPCHAWARDSTGTERPGAVSSGSATTSPSRRPPSGAVSGAASMT